MVLMGIDIDTQENADGCGLCFEPGQTPDTVYMTASGIQRGQFWNPLVDEPPNGSFALQRLTGCNWRLIDSPWSYSFGVNVGSSGASITHILPPLETAIFDVTEQCQGGFGNIIDDPAGVFWFGGNMQVTWKPPTAGPSLGGLMDLVISPSVKNWKAEVWPVDKDFFVTRFVNKNGKSRIHVKYDQNA